MKLITVILGILATGTLWARGSKEASQTASPKIEAWFFYEELCGSCQDDEDKFLEILREQIPLAEREAYSHLFHIFNIYQTEGRSKYQQLTSDLGLDRAGLSPPILIIGGRAFQGYDSIRSNIREAYLTCGEDLFSNQSRKTGDRLFEDYPVHPNSRTLVYFYRVTCEECGKVTPLIDALPEIIGDRRIEVLRMNTRSGNNGERIAAFFEAWGVPDQDRKVPIVFFADSYLAGSEAIAEGLRSRLIESQGAWKLLPLISP
ncbi:MAG: hypothetical protein LBG90_08980 [Spirochaetaceae bacterium]|jgi:hypothetical protein|nr:hypothetical protein [Spirochaetaceae bacterium]